MRIYKEFWFEAAHHLPHAFPEGHPNHRIHGHSFRVRVWLKGDPMPETGVIMDLGLVMNALKEAKDALDHRYLNDIEGLEMPTLENITLWLWNKLSVQINKLDEIGIYRDSCGEGCEYYGPERP